MEETIMNQDEIVEETAMVPVTETEIETIADENDVVDYDDDTYVSGYAVLAVGALIGVGIKIAYDKVGKPAINRLKAKIALAKAAHETKEKATKAKSEAVDVEEIHETDDDDTQTED